MAATLKQTLDKVLPECGFPKRTAYVTSTNPADLQLVSLADAAVAFLILQNIFHPVLITASVAAGTSALTLEPGAYSVLSDTLANSTGSKYVFPVTPEAWNEITANGGSEGYARISSINSATGEIQFSKAFAANTTVRYQYIRQPVETGPPGPTVYSITFTEDASRWVYDTRLLETEIKWRIKREKGLPYEDDRMEAIQYRNNLRPFITNARTLIEGTSLRHQDGYMRAKGIDY